MSSSGSWANRGRTPGGHPVLSWLFPPVAANPPLECGFPLAAAGNPIAGECGPSAELVSYRRATGVQSISPKDLAAKFMLGSSAHSAMEHLASPQSINCVFAKITVVSDKRSESGDIGNYPSGSRRRVHLGV